jgi:cytoskeleton protein RodZ
MTVGAQLRQARVEQRRSITEISNATKIQPWVLDALETDRLQEQMSPIYVKGFLSTYAKFLHLEPEPLLAQLPWPKPEEEEETVQPVSAPPRPSISFEPLWLLLKRLRPAAAAVVVIALIVIAKPTRWLPAIKLPHRQASIVVPSEPSPPRPAAAVKPSTPPKPAAEAPKPVAATKPSLDQVPLMPVQPLELAMVVHRATWVSVRADGKLLSQQRLPRGAKEVWKAKKQLELVIAKPLQVDVTLNGQPIGPLAVTHQGRLLITHDGVKPLPDQR